MSGRGAEICIGDSGDAAAIGEVAAAAAAAAAAATAAILSMGGGVMEEELLSFRIGSRSKN